VALPKLGILRASMQITNAVDVNCNKQMGIEPMRLMVSDPKIARSMYSKFCNGDAPGAHNLSQGYSHVALKFKEARRK